jgi:hypothetical protein
VRKLFALVLISVMCVAGCGGGGGSGTSMPPSPSGTTPTAGPPNVESLVIDAGPAALTTPTVNTAFVSVKVCVPGTTTCQTFDHIEVDTGSVGLRILSDAADTSNQTYHLSLPAVTDSSSNQIAECLEFADGYSWGSLATADITLPVSGETASGIIVHIIGAATAAGDPSKANPTCVPLPSSMLVTENTVPTFGANGILGVGLFVNDCNSSGNCDPTIHPPVCSSGSTPPCVPWSSATYFSCPASGCVQIIEAPALQVPNPVVKFNKNSSGATDNNGVIIELPVVSSSGVADPTGGLLIFGIGTGSNNGLGSAHQLPADPATGYISAMLNGKTLTDSYLDSGSNGNFFADSSLTVCPAPNNGFYCPTATTAMNATLGSNNLAADFNVGNADQMFSANPSFTAFPDLAGSNADPLSLDLGLPFFYGRNVFSGFEPNPYYAF